MHTVLNSRKRQPRSCRFLSLFSPFASVEFSCSSRRGNTGAWSPGLASGALSRNRLLNLLLADSLQLLVLRGAKNFLQLRRALIVDGAELFHFLHWRKRRIVLDRLEFGTLFLEDRQHLHLLLWCQLKLLRQRFQRRRRVGVLARCGWHED